MDYTRFYNGMLKEVNEGDKKKRKNKEYDIEALRRRLLGQGGPGKKKEKKYPRY